MNEAKSFGHFIQELRKKRGWSVRDFIEQLGPISEGDKNISAAYITKIEIHGEIPSPKVICRMAEVLNYSEDELLNRAKNDKVRKYQQTLSDKYDKEIALYRTQKERKR